MIELVAITLRSLTVWARPPPQGLVYFRMEASNCKLTVYFALYKSTLHEPTTKETKVDDRKRSGEVWFAGCIALLGVDCWSKTNGFSMFFNGF